MDHKEYLETEYKNMLTELEKSFKLINIQKNEIERLKSSNRSYLEIVVVLGQELFKKRNKK